MEGAGGEAQFAVMPGLSGGGACADRIGSYKCTCADNWAGANCAESTVPALPPCDATQVTDSNRFQDGSIAGVVGDVFSVLCDSGFSGGGAWACAAPNGWEEGLWWTGPDPFNPSDEWTAGANGLWTGSGCSANACAATQVANSDLDAAASITGVFKDVSAVTCDGGYSGGGDWTCGPDGLFTGTVCSANECTATAVADSDRSGVLSISGVTDEVVTVTCNAGFSGGSVSRSKAEIDAFLAGGCQDGGDGEQQPGEEWPPACVAACDWGTDPDWVCPDPTACDTTDCPTDGEHSKDRLDAFPCGRVPGGR